MKTFTFSFLLFLFLQLDLFSAITGNRFQILLNTVRVQVTRKKVNVHFSLHNILRCSSSLFPSICSSRPNDLVLYFHGFVCTFAVFQRLFGIFELYYENRFPGFYSSTLVTVFVMMCGLFTRIVKNVDEDGTKLLDTV